MILLRVSINKSSKGTLPDCWLQFQEQLVVLNLCNNNLSGKIPSSLGSLHQRKALYLRGNAFVGELPMSLSNLTKLRLLDVGDNKLSGKFPLALGERLPELYLLILRSNRFYGSLPSQICWLNNLKFLDLSNNGFSGNIPPCFAIKLLSRYFEGQFTSISEVEDDKYDHETPYIKITEAAEKMSLDFLALIIGGDNIEGLLISLEQLPFKYLKSAKKGVPFVVLAAAQLDLHFPKVCLHFLASDNHRLDQFHHHLMLEAERRDLRNMFENISRIILVHSTSGYDSIPNFLAEIMNDKNLEDNDIEPAPKIVASVAGIARILRRFSENHAEFLYRFRVMAWRVLYRDQRSRINNRQGFPDSVDGRASDNHISSNLTSATNVSEGHEPRSELVPAGDCGFPASAQAFVEAIKKNRTYQKFLRDKLIKVEARLEENKKLRERIKFLKGFQVDCRKRMGRALSHKKDPRFQLISVPKLRANASKTIDRLIETGDSEQIPKNNSEGRGQVYEIMISEKHYYTLYSIRRLETGIEIMHAGRGLTIWTTVIKINTNSPGAEVAADSTATLDAASIVIKMVDSGYSSRLLKHSKSLFRFSDKYRTNNPILLQQHREKMHKAMKDVNDARAIFMDMVGLCTRGNVGQHRYAGSALLILLRYSSGLFIDMAKVRAKAKKSSSIAHREDGRGEEYYLLVYVKFAVSWFWDVEENLALTGFVGAFGLAQVV
ncbi:Myb domain protein 4r1 [Tanacetum coccineum]